MRIQVDVVGGSVFYENMSEAVRDVFEMCSVNQPPHGIYISMDGEYFHYVKLSDFV